MIVFDGRVGVASFNSGLCHVHCSESILSLKDIEDVTIRSVMDVPGEFLWLLQFLTVEKPEMLLVPSAGSQVILDIALLCGVNVVVRAPSEFDSLCVWNILADLWSDVTQLEWCARLCPQKHVMLMALSALLIHLQRAQCLIADVAEIPPLGILYVDDDTLSSLQITRKEHHPMDYQGLGKSKEGLSLLSVVDRTCSSLGGALLRRWFALPLLSESELQKRLDVVDFFTNTENREVMSQLRRSLRQLRHPGSIFTKIRAAKHTVGDYSQLLRSAVGLLQIASTLSGVAHMLPIFMKIVASCQSTRLEELSNIITTSISFPRGPSEELSKTYVRIRPGCDAELDELREHLTNLDEILTQAVQEEERRLPPHWGSYTLLCVFVPQWGYAITVPNFPPAAVGGKLPEGWELLLCTDDGPFFKTPLTREMDEAIGDLRSAILEREGYVQRQVDHRLLELSPALIPVHFCAELDCLIGFALCALEGQWCRPKIVEEAGALEIHRAFHPILATTLQQVVPCSLTIRDSEQRLCVVTGANGSGKSVFITSIAHTVFLAHIGSYVPCASATIGLTDTFIALHNSSIYTENGNWAAATKELHSSFGNELASMSRMLQRCSSRCSEGGKGAARTLLVIDEFGRGTLSTDGAALLAASLKAFVSMGEGRPVVLLATHYVEAIQPKIISRKEILLIEMMTSLTSTSRKRPREGTVLTGTSDAPHCAEGDCELVFSFTAVPVLTDTPEQNEFGSHALIFASQYSVPEVLLQRAWHVMTTELT